MPEPSWSAQLVLIGGNRPAAPSSLMRASVEVEVLEAPAQLLGRHHLALAELRLRDADRLDDDHAVDDAAGVDRRCRGATGSSRLPLLRAVDLLLDVLHHREVGARRGERRADVALRRIARGNHVLFRARPPHAEHLVARVADLRRGLERDGVHHAVASTGSRSRAWPGGSAATATPARCPGADGNLQQLEADAWRAARRAPGSAPCRTPSRGRGTRSSCPSACRARLPSGRGTRSSPPSGPSTWCRAGTPTWNTRPSAALARP